MVLERDKHTCQKCGRIDDRIEAHHIKPKDQYPKLALDIENGITVCYHCHSLKAMQLKLFRVNDSYKSGYWYPKRLLQLAKSRFHNQPI